MEVETALIKLIIIICVVLVMGILIFGINRLPIFKFLKKTLSIILVIFCVAWAVNLFVGPKLLSEEITTWVKHFIAQV